MESWRKVWREGFAPRLPLAGLQALRDALISDNKSLFQGATTSPPSLTCVADWPVEGACAITYCGWRGLDLETVAAASEFFSRACFDADVAMQEPAACRWFLNWFDDTPREEMRRQLLPEVERTIERHGH